MTSQIPLLFSAEMMRAHLSGLKTETRRVLKKPSWAQSKGWPEGIMDEMDLSGRLQWYHKDTGCCSDLPIAQPGDLIWAKENYRFHTIADLCRPGIMQPGDAIHYEADGKRVGRLSDNGGFSVGKLRPSIHMPKWASRLTLRVTEVAVERLQDISAESCKREGVSVSEITLVNKGFLVAYRAAYRHLWNRINGPDAWAQNPWVIVYRYEPIWQNVLEVAG